MSTRTPDAPPTIRRVLHTSDGTITIESTSEHAVNETVRYLMRRDTTITSMQKARLELLSIADVPHPTVDSWPKETTREQRSAMQSALLHACDALGKSIRGGG